MGITDKYETEIHEVPPDVVARGQKEFEAGEALLETATEETMGAKHVAWIRPFRGLIDRLDPHGEDFSGGSLVTNGPVLGGITANHQRTDSSPLLFLAKKLP